MVTAFVDTNILLYSVIPGPEDREKHRIAVDILRGGPLVMSVQVLNEFVWQSTHSRRMRRIDAGLARAMTDGWSRHRIQPLDLAVFNAGWVLSERVNYSWWDCLIIAAAQAAGCSVLFSEDMQHGHVIDGLRIENPFIAIG